MNNHRNLVSFVRAAARSAVASLFALTLLFAASAEAADDAAVRAKAPAAVTNQDHSGWSLNATPVLIFPDDGYGWGGGADPELKQTWDLGWARLSAGGRIGAYYAKSQFGVTVMPTVRFMVPVGKFEPYVSAGTGYGWLPESDHANFATMGRTGFVYRFSKKFAIGVELTVQQLDGSNFRFPSVGSMMAFDL